MKTKICIKGDNTKKTGRKILSYLLAFGAQNPIKFTGESNLWYYMKADGDIASGPRKPYGYTTIPLSALDKVDTSFLSHRKSKKVEKPKESIVTNNRSSYIDQAKDLIHGNRLQDYGPMKESFERIAMMWSFILGTTVTPHQVCTCMIALKLSRESAKHKDDNLIDIIGYAEISNLIKE